MCFDQSDVRGVRGHRSGRRLDSPTRRLASEARGDDVVDTIPARDFFPLRGHQRLLRGSEKCVSSRHLA